MAASRFAPTFVKERRKRLNLNNKTLYDKNKGAAKIFAKIFKDYLKYENVFDEIDSVKLDEMKATFMHVYGFLKVIASCEIINKCEISLDSPRETKHFLGLFLTDYRNMSS